jgi:hypothetical protein
MFDVFPFGCYAIMLNLVRAMRIAFYHLVRAIKFTKQ